MSGWKILSGGQTGVDRAALDAARALGLAYGGFVPKSRRTENGALPADYAGMSETPSANHAVRTERNVAAADATLILIRGEPDEGTRLTARCAEALGKPLLAVDIDDPDARAAVSTWLAGLRTGTLNVAGPRESHVPGIYRAAKALLLDVLPA